MAGTEWLGFLIPISYTKPLPRSVECQGKVWPGEAAKAGAQCPGGRLWLQKWDSDSSLAIPWDYKSVLTNVSGDKIITYLACAMLLGWSRGYKGNEDTFPGQAIERWFQAS